MDFTPVVLVVRHSGIAHIDGQSHQEELNGGPQQTGPLPGEPGLHLQLSGHQPAVSWAHECPQPAQPRARVAKPPTLSASSTHPIVQKGRPRPREGVAP